MHGLRKSLKLNVIANMSGRLWSSVLNLVAIPIFVRVLGAEAYGLAGLFVSLQLICDFFDLGLAGTATRELAQNTAAGRDPSESKRLVRTFEVVYWAVALSIGACVVCASGWMTSRWINVEQLSHAQVQLALVIMAVAFMARWPTLLYGGVMSGLQEQVALNAIAISASTLRVLGSVAVVIWVSPTITAFLLTQAMSYILEVSATATLVWKKLNHQSPQSVRFDPRVLKRIWRFAFSFNLAGTLGVILAGADRIMISKFLPIAQLGYYSIASTAAGAILLVAYSLGLAVFPRFAARAAGGVRELLVCDYRRTVNATSCLCVAAGLGVSLFSFEILSLWTYNPDVVRQTATVLSLLAAANILFSLQNPAYLLLLATGHTRIPLRVTFASLSISLPMMLFLIPTWGTRAAASIWLVQNFIYLSVYTYCAHRMVLKTSAFTSLARDVSPYLLLGLLWFGGARLLTLSNLTMWPSLIALLVAVAGYSLSVLPLLRARGILPPLARLPLPVLLKRMWPRAGEKLLEGAAAAGQLGLK